MWWWRGGQGQKSHHSLFLWLAAFAPEDRRWRCAVMAQHLTRTGWAAIGQSVSGEPGGGGTDRRLMPNERGKDDAGRAAVPLGKIFHRAAGATAQEGGGAGWCRGRCDGGAERKRLADCQATKMGGPKRGVPSYRACARRPWRGTTAWRQRSPRRAVDARRSDPRICPYQRVRGWARTGSCRLRRHQGGPPADRPQSRRPG